MLEEGNKNTWICRRYPELTMPMQALVRYSPEGVPYVTPEVQLFMKAKDPRPKDEVDFAVVTPLLHTDARVWLLDAIRTYFPGHPWLKA